MILTAMMAASVAVTLIGLVVLSVVATRHPAFQPATGSFLVPAGTLDPAADTIDSRLADGTLAGDWQQAELHSLSAVEDMLDQLEAARFRSREMTIVSNDTFVVRWR